MNAIKSKIFIVDNNPLFRKAVGDYLEDFGYCSIVGEASNGEEFLKQLSSTEIDVVLMDVNMPILNGLDTTKIINQQYTNTIKIIGLSQHKDFEYMKSMIEAGASGYVVKAEMGTQLTQAIQTVMKGKFYFPELTK